ncbi:MAG: polysaccharide biosynthesis protein [Alphaproteobacteria bacterium]
MAAASFVLSLFLRLGDRLLSYDLVFVLQGTGLFALVCAFIFWIMRLYSGVWRYASLNDLMAITRAVTLAILVYLPLLFLLTRLEAYPRSAVIINWFVLIGLLGGPRFLYRIVKDRRAGLTHDTDGSRRAPVLLIGAGDAAELFIRALRRSRRARFDPVGLVDEKGKRVGRNIHGVPILGDIQSLPSVVNRLARDGNRPERLIVTKDGMSGAELRALFDMAEALGISLSRLPRQVDFGSAQSESGVEIKPIALEDLLGRPQTALDRAAMKDLIRAKRVLITGAGGTIGAELARQIADLAPARLALLDNSEYQLYGIDLELGERRPGLDRVAIIGDVRDAARVDAVFADERPDLVFHAAALKHVPIVEAHACEGVLTNVVGTRHVADACRATGVAIMVLVSTDKAVNPASVMGATKRIAESYCQALDVLPAEIGHRTHFVTVRFGNVLGSTGSVVPLFQHQLAHGGPLTVTHPNMVRYFMTVHEAVELVLQASALGASSPEQQGKISVLNMGDPVRIVDLARQMILLAGLKPDQDIKIEFTSPRPGEKLSEEVLHGRETLVSTDHDDILLAAPRAADHAFLARAVDELAAIARAGDQDGVVSLIGRLVPEYRSSAEIPFQSAPRPSAKPDSLQGA